MLKPGRAAGLAIAATVLSVGIAACANSSGGSGVSGSSGSGSSEILIGSEMPLTGPVLTQPQLKAGIEASVNAVNTAGGIDGHKIKLQTCDTQYTVNGELSCMRTLIQDNVSAIVAPTIIADQSGEEDRLAAQAGIPIIGSPGEVQADYNTPGVFPLSSGIPGWIWGAVQHLIEVKATKIALLGSTDAGSEYGLKVGATALNAAGLKPTASVIADPQADPTFATAAAKVVDAHVQGVYISLPPSYIPNAVLALKQAGFQGKISTITATFTPSIIKALGPSANGVLVTGQVAFASDTANPGISQFLADMNRYAPGATIDEVTIQGWTAVQLMSKVLAHATSFSGKSVTQAFNDIKTPVDVPTMGPFGPPSATPYITGYPRMYNPTVQDGVVSGGVAKNDGSSFVNPFTALKSNGA
jgi:branched-chain amino acid transport system substrate-binding protein